MQELTPSRLIQIISTSGPKKEVCGGAQINKNRESLEHVKGSQSADGIHPLLFLEETGELVLALVSFLNWVLYLFLTKQ